MDTTKVLEMLSNERIRIYKEQDSIIDECRELMEKMDKAFEESGELHSEYLMSCEDYSLDDDVIELLNDYPVNEENIELLNKSKEIRAIAEEYSDKIESLEAESALLSALTEALFDAETRLVKNPAGVRFFLGSLVATAMNLEKQSKFCVSDFSTFLKVSCRITTVYRFFQTILDESRTFTKQDREEILLEEYFRELHDCQ